MANKLRYFIANWKMFGNHRSFNVLYSTYKYLAKKKRILKKSRIIFCIPSTLIHNFAFRLKKTPIKIGAQNCHYDEISSSITGSVNADMLKKAGAEYIIIGHSENRAQGDTNKIIKNKIKSALEKNLKIIFCIGESFKDKKNKKTFYILKKQMRESLLKKFNYKQIIIAYEPIWSIGTGKIPQIKYVIKNLKFMKKELSGIFKTKSYPIILYGGSVNGNNIALFLPIKELDGFLVGAASRSAKKFIDIIKNYYK